MNLAFRTLQLAACVALAMGCGSRTIAGGLMLPDGATVDDPPPFDLGPLPDRPIGFDGGVDTSPPFPDRPPFPDTPPFPDRPLPPDLPGPVDVVPSGNTTCPLAEVIEPGRDVALTFIPEGTFERRSACGSTVLQGGAVRYYRTVLSVGQTLVVTGTTPRFPSAFVRVYPDCAAIRCDAQSSVVSSSPVNAVARFTNSTGIPRAVVFTVGYTDSAAQLEPIAVSVRFVNPAVNGRCTGATRLTPGVTLAGQDTLGALDASMSCPGSSSTQPSLWYRIAVPAGQVLAVSMAPTSAPPGNLQARLITNCTSGVCLPFALTTGPDGRSIALRWANAGGAQDVVLAVNAVSPSAPTTFDVTATLLSAPANAACERAAEVRDGTTLRAQDPGLSSTALSPCPGMPGLAVPGALFYTAEVPAGQTLTASATATVAGRGFYFMRVIPSCTDTSCLAATPAASATASTSWTNTGPTPRRVVIAVTPNAAGATSFDLIVRVRPPPTNTTCMGAARLASGTLVGENLAFAREVSGACLAFGATSGPVLYYTARVGVAERLTVVARRTSSTFFQPLVRVIDGCGGATCLASSATTPMGGDSSRVTWVNPGAARDVVVLVSSSTATPDGTLDLTVALGATPYRMTTLPGACDAMTASTVIPEATGDDRGSASMPLPFAFRYFGTAVTSWSVSTNGYLQVWPVSGMSTGALGSAELPAAGAPASMIAPFWDDLEIDAGAASVRWQRFTASPAHLTVEWTNSRFCCGGGTPDRVTLQAKLFETSSDIEFHYCSLSATPRASGSNASIGIQDATATQGLSWAIRRAGAASVATAVRFAPTM